MIIILSLFTIVFVKMELRRMNYSILRQSRKHQIFLDRYHKKSNELFRNGLKDQKLINWHGPQLTLDSVKKGQVVLLIGGKAAVPQ